MLTSVVICATGFDVSHCPHYPIVGLNGTELAEKWKDSDNALAYMSLASPEFPNYFIMSGMLIGLSIDFSCPISHRSYFRRDQILLKFEKY